MRWFERTMVSNGLVLVKGPRSQELPTTVAPLRQRWGMWSTGVDLCSRNCGAHRVGQGGRGSWHGGGLTPPPRASDLGGRAHLPCCSPRAQPRVLSPGSGGPGRSRGAGPGGGRGPESTGRAVSTGGPGARNHTAVLQPQGRAHPALEPAGTQAPLPHFSIFGKELTTRPAHALGSFLIVMYIFVHVLHLRAP